ncbi:RidA family protein [Paucibacter sp. Y2R2-4]|uniref:RidA family protein n=1 Tax=Paucibacter sp. Y2R2-4 TaxID=2893553 RepID=UPI0021E3958E|nr:Rid family hydrolase [Paucibacter sp. Y2R2-4]MCV2348314.1 RidA family protein [Paucibacter sp. Y2R2-4]
MNSKLNIGVASQIGHYSDAVAIPAKARWFMSSGTPGLGRDGHVPEGVAAQAELAWQHIVSMLEAAGMTLDDLVKTTHYLTRESDIAEYAKVRKRIMGAARPASMLAVIPALVRPGFLVEIEVIAAKADT